MQVQKPRLFPTAKFILCMMRLRHIPAFFCLSADLTTFPLQMEEEPFNPDYVEVDRVLEVSLCEDKDTGEVNTS